MEKVCVVGLGYAGITLATALARKGFDVWGYDVDAAKIASLQRAQPSFHEAGVEEVLRDCQGRNLHLSAEFVPQPYDVVVFAVATPVDPATHRPVMDHLASACRNVAANLQGDPLIVIRSTVPVGTTAAHAAPIFRAVRPGLPVAFAPERTIQGQALREIVELPQIVGGVDEPSLRRAVAFFEKVAVSVVPVSSAATAELIKLLNNCHTDVIYSFGNEAARIAEAVGVDPVEAVRAASLNYPRPKIHMPGYVGGGCLTKDPYLLASSVPDVRLDLIMAARQLNENLPAYTAERVLAGLKHLGIQQDARVLLCGVAFKGKPPTDDLRGSQAVEIIPLLCQAGCSVEAHDPLVSAARIQSLGATPLASLDAIAPGSFHAALFLTDAEVYGRLDNATVAGWLGRPGLLFDGWRLFSRQQLTDAGLLYQSIGV